MPPTEPGKNSGLQPEEVAAAEDVVNQTAPIDIHQEVKRTVKLPGDTTIPEAPYVPIANEAAQPVATSVQATEFVHTDLPNGSLISTASKAASAPIGGPAVLNLPGTTEAADAPAAAQSQPLPDGIIDQAPPTP